MPGNTFSLSLSLRGELRKALRWLHMMQWRCKVDHVILSERMQLAEMISLRLRWQAA
jgi:hypothetical protein